MALVLLPGALFCFALIYWLKPAQPPVSIVHGCYASKGLPLIEVSPPNLRVGDRVIGKKVSVISGKPDYQVHSERGFRLTHSADGSIQIRDGHPKGMIMGVKLDRYDTLSVRVLLDDALVYMPKIDCPVA